MIKLWSRQHTYISFSSFSKCFFLRSSSVRVLFGHKQHWSIVCDTESFTATELLAVLFLTSNELATLTCTLQSCKTSSKCTLCYKHLAHKIIIGSPKLQISVSTPDHNMLYYNEDINKAAMCFVASVGMSYSFCWPTQLL